MAINFPDSPTPLDTFSAGGATYTWDGTVWAALAGAGGGGTVTASGSPLNNEVAVFTTATDIDSDSTFTWDGSILSARTIRAYDTGGTDYVELSDTGAAASISTNANDLLISAQGGISNVRIDNGSNLHLRNGADLVINDSDNSANITFAHGGVDFDITGSATTDINLTGITAINAGTVDADFDAITATSYGGITEANLVDKTATDSISGSRTHTVPILSTMTSATGVLSYGGTGSVVRFGAYCSLSRLFSSAGTALANNAYSDPNDSVSDQMRTAVTHASYGHTIYKQAAGIHTWYGDNDSVTAGAIVSKDLRMTLGATGNLVGTGTLSGFTSISLDDSEKLVLGTGSDVDIYFDGTDTFVDMPNGADFRLRGGAANDLMIVALDDDAVTLYWDGTSCLSTQWFATTGITSSVNLKDHEGNQHDVGFNNLRKKNDNVSDTLEAAHCGNVAFKDAATVRTLTLAAVGDLDFPVLGMTTVINAFTSGNYTITEGATTTLYYLDGVTRTDTTGGCTLGPGGVANIWREAAGVYYIWGTGITP